MKPPMRYRDTPRHKVMTPDRETWILLWTGEDWMTVDGMAGFSPAVLGGVGFRYLKPDEQKGTEI